MRRLTSNLKLISRRLRAPFNRYRAMQRLRDYHSQARDIDETVSWALNFRGNGFYRVKSLQIPEGISALTKAISLIRPRVVLEIGTAALGTLFIWSHIASRKVIICDLQDMKVQSSFCRGFPPFGSNRRVTLLSGNSHLNQFRERVENALDGDDVDFLFIDGDHSEEGVRADFLDYSHLVHSGGIIAFHDIVESQPIATNQVYKLWNTLRGEYVTEEFVADPKRRGFGIGILRVNERFSRID